MKPASWIHVVLGAWLIVAPFVLGYVSHSARSGDVIAGIAVLGIALWEGRTFSLPSGALVAQLMLGAWIFLAPFTMAYVGDFPALINDIIVAALSIITAVAMLADRGIPADRSLRMS